MQRTRLNTLIEVRGQQLTQFFTNPWRRFSLGLLGFLGGFFLGAALSTTAGQSAQWDVVCAGLVLVGCEALSRWLYQRRSPLGVGQEFLQTLKLGVMYSLFLEAFKLGS